MTQAGSGGTRRNAGRPTAYQRQQEPQRRGEKARSVRMLATDAEYQYMMQLTPSQRTFMLLTGWAHVTLIRDKLLSEGGQNERAKSRRSSHV